MGATRGPRGFYEGILANVDPDNEKTVAISGSRDFTYVTFTAANSSSFYYTDSGSTDPNNGLNSSGDNDISYLMWVRIASIDPQGSTLIGVDPNYLYQEVVGKGAQRFECKLTLGGNGVPRVGYSQDGANANGHSSAYTMSLNEWTLLGYHNNVSTANDHWMSHHNTTHSEYLMNSSVSTIKITGGPFGLAGSLWPRNQRLFDGDFAGAIYRFGSRYTAAEVQQIYNLGPGCPWDEIPAALRTGVKAMWTGEIKNGKLWDQTGNGWHLVRTGSVAPDGFRDKVRIPERFRDVLTGEPFSPTATLKPHYWEYDGTDDSLEFGHVPAFNFDSGSTYSIETWFRTSASGANRFLVSQMDSSSPFTGWMIFQQTDNTLRWQLVNNSTTNKINVDADNTYNDGNWHHMVWTYDGSSAASGVKLYIDGKIAATTTVDDTLSASPQTSTSEVFNIGDRNNAGSSTWLGDIGYLRIYSSVVTPQGVRSNYKTYRSKYLTA
jgi:hypothetical protein